MDCSPLFQQLVQQAIQNSATNAELGFPIRPSCRKNALHHLESAGNYTRISIFNLAYESSDRRQQYFCGFGRKEDPPPVYPPRRVMQNQSFQLSFNRPLKIG
jgi:hypothetical protein